MEADKRIRISLVSFVALLAAVTIFTCVVSFAALAAMITMKNVALIGPLLFGLLTRSQAEFFEFIGLICCALVALDLLAIAWAFAREATSRFVESLVPAQPPLKPWQVAMRIRSDYHKAEIGDQTHPLP